MTTSPHDDYSDLEPTIGERLRRAREVRTGLDQEAFAARISVSRGTVSNYERGKLPGGTRERLVLNSWAAATACTVDWFRTGRTPVRPEPEGELGELRARRDSNPQPSDPKVLGSRRVA